MRSLKGKSLGYTGEASIDVWGDSIDALISRYPKAELVVPGHGRHGNTKLLEHTKKLVQTTLKKSYKKSSSKNKNLH